jgi:hypothetical protein
VQAIEAALSRLGYAEELVQYAVENLRANGLELEQREDSLLRLRRELSELLQRDVLQRAGAVPD